MGQPNFKALLIGNSIFDVAPQSLVSLKGPANDVRMLKDTLSHPQVGLFKTGDIKVILDSTQKEILAEIEAFFSRALVDDQLFFYYSGHGILDIKSNLYLCARDTDPERPVSTGISDSQINNMIQGSASSRIIIVLDCCHSGRFKNAVEIPATLVGEGRFVIASTRAGELATDSADEIGLSAFTNYFCKALLSGEVDANKDGFISLGEIYSFVYPLLRNKTKQIPQMKFDDAVGEIIIGRTVTAPADRPAPPSPLQAAPPRLGVSVKKITIDDAGPDERLPEEIIDIFNENGGGIDWGYECNDHWIATERYRNSLKLRFSPRPGINRGRIYIREKTTGATERVEIKVTVVERAPAPRLELSEERIDFGTVILNDKKPSAVIRLFNAGGGKLHPKVTAGSDRVQAALSGDMMTVTLDNSRTGTVSGSITVESEGGNKSVAFSATIVKGPILGASPERVDFGVAEQGAAGERFVKISNKGDGDLQWTAEQRGDWYSIEKSKQGLKISVTREPGTYEGSLIIKSNGGTKTVPISAKIVQKKQPEQQARSTIAGKWQNQFGWIMISGSGPVYQLADYNLMGICVGNGTITQTGTMFAFQEFSILAGQIQGTLSLDPSGRVLSGTLMALWGSNQVAFNRG